MTTNIVQSNIASLLDGWIEAERKGVQFPVPFEAAYPMAGYSRKDSAKRYLPKTAQGILYHVSRNEGKGRPTEQITLSIAGLEHLCLMADTPEGHEIREYFRLPVATRVPRQLRSTHGGNHSTDAPRGIKWQATASSSNY